MSLPAVGIALAASAASAASTASAARPGGFDPATTLPWAVPLMLAAPLVAYVLVLGGVRSRRAAANVTLLAVAVMLAATLLTAWARLRQAGAYRLAFQWINVPVAFSGDPRFQGFGVDLAFRLDHLALAGLVTVLAVFLACLAWHRAAGRGEQGPIRYQVNALLLALGAAGALVSGELAELLAFWLVAGVATYLLLGHRWGTEGAGRRSRVALALPFVGDVSLLCAVGILYSRFGLLDPERLNPVLSTTPGVGLKSLTAAAVLIFVAVAARACVWPLTAWQTGTVEAPPASVALAAGVWPVLAGALLLRMLPLIGAAGVQAPRIAGYALGVAAVVGPLLGLVGVELRRSLLLASSGAVALTLLGILYPASAPLAFTGLLAVGAGRAGALLAGSSAVAAMRTADLRAMGGAWGRMPGTAVGLLVAAAVIALSGSGAAGLSPRSPAWIAFAAGLALVAIATLRVYFAVSHGPLRRRRAFEPERVREAPAQAVGAALGAGLLGLVAVALGFFTPWVAFLQPASQALLGVGTNVLWAISVAVGVGVAAVAFWLRRDASLALGARLGELFGAAWEIAGRLFERFFERPGGRIVSAVEDVGLPAVESGVERAVAGSGGLLDRSLPWVPAVLGLAVVLAVAFGLLSQGIGR